MARRGLPTCPLPQRDGVDAVRLRLPQEGPWATLRDHLVDRIPLPAHRIDALLASGQVVDADGMPLPPDAPFVPRSLAWMYRDLPDEVPVPFDVDILSADERILVVDKPPFLATMPRGRHVRETALARMRVALDLPRLAPAHRLDRLTSGVLVFTTEQRWRGPYQRLFATGSVAKEYLAVAPVRADVDLPVTIQNHLASPRGALRAAVIAGRPPNSQTTIELVEVRGGRGLYRLTPTTGRTHQLRAHLAALGIPIYGDPLYPELVDTDPGDYSRPLALVAARLHFTDPVDGSRRSFTSRWQPFELADEPSKSKGKVNETGAGTASAVVQ